MGAAPTIDVTILAHREPRLGALVRSWLPHANRIIVVLGGTEEVHAMGLPFADAATERSVREVSDPCKQVTLVPPPGRHWSDKNEMALAAAEHLSGDLVWQVDADECHRSADIERVRTDLGADDRWELAAPEHLIFWRDLGHVLSRESGDRWFAPARIWRRRDGEAFLHLPFSRIRRADGHVVEAGTRRLPWCTCYHLAWIGDERVAFRIRFHEARAKLQGGDRPHADWLDRVWRRGEVPARGVHPSPSAGRCFPTRYSGPPLPPVARELVGGPR